MPPFQQITIEVDTESFEFKKDSEHIRLITCAHFERINNQWVPVNIGELRDIPEALLVNFFKNEETPTIQEFDKLELLTFFIQYGIGSVLSKRFLPIIRPFIIYKGDNKLKKVLCGYQRSILEEVAYRSGARRVRFD